MQITFLTLLLGLASGQIPVEVAVSGEVAAVELLVDGVVAARMSGPPWAADVDFGPELLPRELVARALDREGREVARAAQWVNLPRPQAEVQILLESDAKGRPVAAHLSWQSVTATAPDSILLTLDGRPLPVDGKGRATLPPTDPKVTHLLTAELLFPPGIPARKDVVFGGEWGSAVSTDLTAVPVRLGRRVKLPAVDRLGDLLSIGGRPLDVAAVEEGAGRLFVVRAATQAEVSSKLAQQGGRWVPGQQRFQMQVDLRHEMKLGREDEIRFVFPTARFFRGTGVSAELFDSSRAFSYEDGGMRWLLGNVEIASESEPRIADAVAVAGLMAATDHRRRAVVLVVGRDAADTSRYDPATVRRYLSALAVPLFVWSLESPDSPAAKAWAIAEDVSNQHKLYAAVKRVKDELEAQRIVWVEGRHLPQSIALDPSAKGIELLGLPR